MKRTLILSVLISLVWQAGALALTLSPKSDDAKTRAASIIEQAREAIGGEGKLKSIKSIAVSGNYRRVIGDRETSGEIEYEMLLPDKIRRTETMSPIPNATITRIDVMNGEQIWSDTQSGSMGGMVMIRRPGAENDAQRQKIYENSVRADFARFLLGLLLTAPSSFPLDYSFAGEAEAPDGRADAIDISGPNNFSVRLYIDQKSHLPLMFSYRGRQPNIVMRTVTSGGLSREEAEKRAQESIDKMEKEQAPPPEVEFQVALDDFRKVDGVLIPHLMTRSVDGKVTEEVTLSKLKINPSIKPQVFEKK